MQQGIKSKPVNLGLTKIIAALLPGQLYIPKMMIFHEGSIWECIKEHKCDGTFVSENWMHVSKSSSYVLLDHPELASVHYYPDDYKVPEGLIAADSIYSREDYELLYEYYAKFQPELIIDENTFRTPKISSIEGAYNPNKTYKKGDVIIRSPLTYDTQTIPSGSNTINHMGRYVDYSAESYVKQFDVKMRAKRDNPGNPDLNRANWEPVDYLQLIEWGANKNGEFWLFANGNMRTKIKVTTNGTYSYPVATTQTQDLVSTVAYHNNGLMASNSHDQYFYVQSSTATSFTTTYSYGTSVCYYFEGKWYNI